MNTTEISLANSKLASGREYREAFVASFLKRYIPFQIRTIRKKRGMSQPALAQEANITQGVISRAEDPDYGNLTFNTVLRIAAGFDLAFVGKFIPFSELQKVVHEMSEDALDLPSFTKECELEAAATIANALKPTPANTIDAEVRLSIPARIEQEPLQAEQDRSRDNVIVMKKPPQALADQKYNGFSWACAAVK